MIKSIIHKIRIKLKSYDNYLVDKSADQIVKSIKTTGAIVNGPICLPTQKQIFTVLRSPHVNKKSRDQYELRSHSRIIDIYSSCQRTVDALMKLEISSGVEVEIKI
jgi:small subunit ribosomal protein S10